MEKSTTFAAVLILVLMEDGLRVENLDGGGFWLSCLNPCFNGRWSARGKFATRRFADL